MAKENAFFTEQDILDGELTDAFDFEELEAKLQGQLEEEFAGLEFLQDEREMINNPDALGETIKNVVWEQFINQIAVTAGEDFIRENNGLLLDLRNDAHIQTADNFAEGKLATHNHISRDDLEENYHRYKNTPHKTFREEYVDPGMDAALKRAGELKKQGIDTVTDIYTGRQIPTASKTKDGKYDPNAAQREHVKSSAELYKNPSLQMANSNEELAAVINNPENLQGYTTAARNNRKSDKSADEMNPADKNKHWEKANERAETYIGQVEKQGEERLKNEGRRTQKEEAFRIGGAALRAVILQLLAELAREIFLKLVLWFKSAVKKVETLLDALKMAIISFVGKLQKHLINAADTLLTTIATAIFGPVVETVKKVFSMLRQSWYSLKEAAAYIKDPENKEKPMKILILEVGKIVMAGLSVIGAEVLAELIEIGLVAIPSVGPVFAFQIPLLGSLASLLGMFLGGVVAGIVGAIAINLIQKKIDLARKGDNAQAQMDTGNDILKLQYQLQSASQAKVSAENAQKEASISHRHAEAARDVRESLEKIVANCKEDETIGQTQNEIGKLIKELDGE